MRRLALLVLVLATPVAGALAIGSPAADAPAPEDDRYVVVDGTCLERIEADAALVAGRPVADALCAAE